MLYALLPVVLLKHVETWLPTLAFFMLFGGRWGVSSLQGHQQTQKGYWGWRPHRTQQRWPSVRGTWTESSTGDTICKRWWIAAACTQHRRWKPVGRRHRGPPGQPAPGGKVTNGPLLLSHPWARAHSGLHKATGGHRCTHHSLENALLAEKSHTEAEVNAKNLVAPQQTWACGPRQCDIYLRGGELNMTGFGVWQT